MIAVMMDELTWYPSADSWKPAKVTWRLKNRHFSMFNKMLWSPQHCRNCLTFCSWSSMLLSYMTKSSMICQNPERSLNASVILQL